MWNSSRHEEEDDDNNNGVVGLQPVLVGNGQQNNENFITIQTGRAIASGNGPPIYAINKNIRNYYNVYPPLPRYEPPRPSSSLFRSGNKRALLCGDDLLDADLAEMKELLVKDFGFPIHCIRVLSGTEQSPDLTMTRENTLESLKWLVKDCQPGDSLVFYYHGYLFKNVINMRQASITVNEIKSTIVGLLKKGVTLHAIVDALGTGDECDGVPIFADLKYVYKQKNGIWNWKDNKPNAHDQYPIHHNHTNNGGLVICLSTWRSLFAALPVHCMTGKEIRCVLTYLLTKAFPGIPYSSLLNMMHSEIKNIHNVISVGRALQCPTLSSSEKFDVSTKIFTM